MQNIIESCHGIICFFYVNDLMSFQIPDSRLQIQDSRLQTPDSRLQTPTFKIQDFFLASTIIRVRAPPASMALPASISAIEREERKEVEISSW